jgi:hypothetical protein
MYMYIYIHTHTENIYIYIYIGSLSKVKNLLEVHSKVTVNEDERHVTGPQKSNGPK